MSHSPQVVPIDWKVVEDALHAWVSQATGVVTIWANQDAPQPDYPYCVLDVIAGPTRIGGIDEVRVSMLSPVPPVPAAPGTLEHVGPREITVAVQALVGKPFDGNPSAHARALMASAQGALGLELTRARLREGGLAVIQDLPMTQLDFPIGDRWTARVQMDVRFGLASNVSEPVYVIETAHVEGTINGSPVVDGDFGVGG